MTMSCPDYEMSCGKSGKNSLMKKGLTRRAARDRSIIKDNLREAHKLGQGAPHLIGHQKGVLAPRCQLVHSWGHLNLVLKYLVLYAGHVLCNIYSDCTIKVGSRVCNEPIKYTHLDELINANGMDCSNIPHPPLFTSSPVNLFGSVIFGRTPF